MRLFRRSSFSAWPARTRPPIIRHSVDSVNDVQRRSSCPEITAHGLAILRAVDEFRFEGRSTKGGRETADAICVALRLISLSLSLSLSLSNALPRYHGYSYFKLEVFILTEPFLSRRSSLFVICFQFSFNLCIKIPYLRYIRVSYIFFFFSFPTNA